MIDIDNLAALAQELDQPRIPSKTTQHESASLMRQARLELISLRAQVEVLKLGEPEDVKARAKLCVAACFSIPDYQLTGLDGDTNDLGAMIDILREEHGRALVRVATFEKAFDLLQEVVCDPSGKASIRGSDGDKLALDGALQAFKAAVTPAPIPAPTLDPYVAYQASLGAGDPSC